MTLSEEQFQAVTMAFITDDEFAGSFENFAKENCGIFTEDEEQKLEYTKVYQKFQELFESKITELLEGQSTNPEEFYASLKEAVEKGDSCREEFLQLILALTDYEMFVQTMREEKLRKDRAEASMA
mmetsp:Transcript_38339/g.108379  ORF Transcript_38339/g.108379 Transcript_38339/m.108379 type:complete len:126 (+) Transcript_38339:287-664(+)|eukprot:CAMPEP_0117680716 /NCGR_PEP_ID=MMETSP0804-20121206/18524_1 /TAXON_ID=1074897 /ORGANISM="Tetraselmis astigmatica, Strain CCMP880" /LENGTH=125 /DNA_ID=CAMNT_0005490279 /DNA_START=189 /DNA_END=566 /DNA_ORIENTATION=-